jgi:subtilisin family serine protease
MIRPSTIRALLLLAAVAAPLQAQGLGSLHPEEGANRIVVEVDSPSELARLLQQTELQIVKSVPGTGIYLLGGRRALARGEALNKLQMLSADPATTIAELDATVLSPEGAGCGSVVAGGVGAQPCTVAFFDGDPTPSEFSDQPATAAVNLGTTGDLLQGLISIVAVIDTGVDFSHPLLAPQILSTGYDFINETPVAWDTADGRDNDRDGFVDEAFGHGTHIAGTIALINPDARILPYRVLDSDGNGTLFEVARAVYAATVSGADVINLSLSATTTSATLDRALVFAHAMGVQVISSAGNSSTGAVSYPASHEGVEAVAALDDFGVKADFSNWGYEVELSAPGVNIYSTMPGERYAWWSGTSMATAVVSGSVSLSHSLSLVFGADTEDSVDYVTDTAFEVDDLNPSYDDLLGDGLPDLTAAAAKVQQEGASGDS